MSAKVKQRIGIALFIVLGVAHASAAVASGGELSSASTITLGTFILIQTVVISRWSARLSKTVELLEKQAEDHEERLREIERSRLGRSRHGVRLPQDDE